MFQFPTLASITGFTVFNSKGSPIRTPPDLRSCAAPQSFSQLAASFFASYRLGIHRLPFLAFNFLN